MRTEREGRARSGLRAPTPPRASSCEERDPSSPPSSDDEPSEEDDDEYAHAASSGGGRAVMPPPVPSSSSAPFSKCSSSCLTACSRGRRQGAWEGDHRRATSSPPLPWLHPHPHGEAQAVQHAGAAGRVAPPLRCRLALSHERCLCGACLGAHVARDVPAEGLVLGPQHAQLLQRGDLLRDATGAAAAALRSHARRPEPQARHRRRRGAREVWCPATRGGKQERPPRGSAARDESRQLCQCQVREGEDTSHAALLCAGGVGSSRGGGGGSSSRGSRDRLQGGVGKA